MFTRNWTYDLAGRVVSESFPKFGPYPATVQSYDYTHGGNLAQVSVDGAVYARYEAHNALGQPSRRVLDPGQASEVISRFTYDNMGLLASTQVTDALGQEIQNLAYGFDALGNVAHIDDFTSYGEEEEEHDQGHHYGQDEEERDRGHHYGQKDEKERDEHDRRRDRDDILSAGVNLSQNQIFEYDALGQLIRATGAYGDKTYAYDQIGNMTHIGAMVDRDLVYDGTRLIAGTRTEITYNGAGAMVGKLQDGVEWAYRYNALGHLTEVYREGALQQANAYDYKGQRILRRVYQGSRNHKVHTTFYPTAGLTVQHDHRGNQFKVTKTITAGFYGKLASFEEHYAFEDRDESGQWAVYSNMFDQGTPKGMALALGYRFLSKVSDRESLSRLPYVFFALLSVSVLAAFLWSQARRWRGTTQEPSRFGMGNRLLALSMVFMMFWLTACGNSNQSRNADVNSPGAFVGEAGEDLEDFEGGGTEGTSEDLGEAPEELEHLGSSDLLPQLVQTKPISNKAFFHPNHIQTATLITDAQGHVAARIRHLPFGEVDVQATVDHRQSAEQYAAFTGQELDEATGLIYYNARYYDPSLGRFISPDTLVDGDGTAAIHFNRYVYVRNNPTNFTDPTGHAVSKVILGKSGWSSGTAWALTESQYSEWMRLPYRDRRHARSYEYPGIFTYLWDDYQADLAQAQEDLAVAEEEAAAAEEAEEAARLAELERIRLELIRQGQIDAANAFREQYETLLHADAGAIAEATSQTNGAYQGSDGPERSGTVRDAAQSDEFWLFVGITVMAAVMVFCSLCIAVGYAGAIGGFLGGAVYGWGHGINVKHFSGEKLYDYIAESAITGTEIGLGLQTLGGVISGGGSFTFEGLMEKGTVSLIQQGFRSTVTTGVSRVAGAVGGLF